MKRLKLKGAFGKAEIRNIKYIAKEVLEKVGVEIESEKVKELLYNHGAEITKQEGRRYDVALIPQDLVDKTLKTVPTQISMYDRNKEKVAVLAGRNTYFNPGSCGVHYYDCRTDSFRTPTTTDLEEFVRVADALKNIHMQSTAMTVGSVDKKIHDVYRLNIVLKNSTKPIVTGTFDDQFDNFEKMKDMLVAVRGSEKELKEKPLAIFDCCPSPTLKWPRVWSEDLIRCGKYGIPAEFISMPQPGMSAPIALYDNLIQHTAETFSGIVISQLANPGAPLIYGGSPTGASSEAMLGDIVVPLMDTAYATIAKSLKIPCQAYLGLSDSKRIDIQAGYEKGITLTNAVLAGFNNISGPGMLLTENCQSKEMLVIDDEYCGALLYFVKGIQKRETDTIDEISRMASGKGASYESFTLFNEEIYKNKLANQQNLVNWQKSKKGMFEKAIHKTDEILFHHKVEPLNSDVVKELDSLIKI